MYTGKYLLKKNLKDPPPMCSMYGSVPVQGTGMQCCGAGVFKSRPFLGLEPL